MVDKITINLIEYIKYFDSMRPPVNYLSSLKSSLVFYKDSNTKEHDTKFYNDVRKFRDVYFWQASRNVLILLLLPLPIFLTFTIFFLLTTLWINKQISNETYSFFSMVLEVVSIVLIIGYLLFAVYTLRVLYLRNKGVIDQEMNQKTIVTVSKIIKYTKEYFKEQKIGPKKYPLHLRHNDYEGLTYEKLGENNYIAYLRID